MTPPSTFWKRVLPPAEGPVPEPPSADRLEGSDDPIARLVYSTVCRAVAEGASDIHIEPSNGDIVVRFRVDGFLDEGGSIPLEIGPMVEHWVDLAVAQDVIDCEPRPERYAMWDPDLTEAERRKIAEWPAREWVGNPLARVVVDCMRQPVRLRRTSTATGHGNHLALRIVPVRRRPPSLGDLGMAPEPASALVEMIRPREFPVTPQPGLALVVGGKSSGRTTTARTLLDMYASPKIKIVVIGDPAEFADVWAPVAATVAPDADVLVIDGIADESTARLAVESAMGGRLVLATMAAPDAPTGIVRLVDFGISPQILAASLRCVVAQQLVRRLCPSCCVTDEVDDTTYRNRGCPRCGQTGYRGRAPLFEVLAVQPDLRAAIEFGSLHEIAAAATEHGMASLREDGLRLVREGVTSLEELRRVTSDRLS